MTTEYRLSYTASEINNKLGKIDKHSGQITEMSDDINVLETRMNMFTALEDGTTTADAEIMDARIDNNGNEHENLGDSIRTQNKTLNTKLDSVIIPVALSPIDIYEDKRIGSNGQIIDETGFKVYLLKIKPSTNYYFGRVNDGRNYTVFLNDKKEFIDQYVNLYPSYDAVITTPNNAYYVMHTVQDGYDGLIIEETMYNEYGIVRGAVDNININLNITKSLDIEKTTFKQQYMVYNLHNPETDIDGYYTDVNDEYGTLKPNANYCVTEKIPVSPNQTLRFVTENGEYFNCRIIAEYDANGQYLGGVQNVDYYTQHDDVASIVVNLRMATERNAMIADECLVDYVPYNGGEFLNEKHIIKNNGKDKTTVKGDAVTSLTIEKFPKYLKTAQSLTFKCEFDDAFQYIKIGKGYNTYRGHWLYIDGANIVHHKYESSDIVVTTVTHNLGITNYLNVILDIDGENAVLTLNSTGGTFSHTFNFECECCGTPFVTNEAFPMKNVVFNATSKSFNKDVWMFGDSYFGVNNTRTIGQLKNLGIFEDVLIDGLAGQTSSGAFDELQKALSYGKPKYIVWCLGMNDDDNSHQTYLNKVKDICKKNNIKLVLATIPTVPIRSKETISFNVRNSGYQYIDFYNSVGANSSGGWYAGYLSVDNVHPTELGAKALATQVLIDFPEILKYRN